MELHILSGYGTSITDYKPVGLHVNSEGYAIILNDAHECVEAKPITYSLDLDPSYPPLLTFRVDYAFTLKSDSNVVIAKPDAYGIWHIVEQLTY